MSVAPLPNFAIMPSSHLPNPVYGQRSTWDIVWACLATTFACTWLSVHPNIPAPNERWLWIMLRRLKIMFWALIAPELVIFWAMRQRRGARLIANKFRSHGWTMTHGHFLQMGGFMLCDKNGKAIQTVPYPDFEFLVTGVGHISFPSISKDEIMDKSKRDLLAKVVALTQVTWFIFQGISRAVRHLAITEMELTTVALSVLNFILHFLWWDKPFDVRLPVYLIDTNVMAESTDEEDEPEDFRFAIIAKAQNFRKDIHEMGLLRVFIEALDFLHMGEGAIEPHMYGKYRVPTYYAVDGPGISEQGGNNPAVLSACAGSIFGAIHLLAWSSDFASHVEQNIWRTASLIVTITPLLLAAIVVTYNTKDYRRICGTSWAVLGIVWNALGTSYVLARLCLLVEAVISLRALPSTAYDTVQWINHIPHVC